MLQLGENDGQERIYIQENSIHYGFHGYIAFVRMWDE